MVSFSGNLAWNEQHSQSKACLGLMEWDLRLHTFKMILVILNTLKHKLKVWADPNAKKYQNILALKK